MKQKTSATIAPAPSGPPRYKPKPKSVHPIDVAFAADPFDPRFVQGTADRRLTPLGAMVQTFHYLRQHLIAMCPDAVEFLESQDE